MKSPWTELPPQVESYVKKKLVAVDWNAALEQLRSVCADCPARQQGKEEEVCLACPFEGLACMAATVSLKAKVEKLRNKAQKDQMTKEVLKILMEENGGENCE